MNKVYKILSKSQLKKDQNFSLNIFKKPFCYTEKKKYKIYEMPKFKTTFFKKQKVKTIIKKKQEIKRKNLIVIIIMLIIMSEPILKCLLIFTMFMKIMVL